MWRKKPGDQTFQASLKFLRRGKDQRLVNFNSFSHIKTWSYYSYLVLYFNDLPQNFGFYLAYGNQNGRDHIIFANFIFVSYQLNQSVIQCISQIPKNGNTTIILGDNAWYFQIPTYLEFHFKHDRNCEQGARKLNRGSFKGS